MICLIDFLERVFLRALGSAMKEKQLARFFFSSALDAYASSRLILPLESI